MDIERQIRTGCEAYADDQLVVELAHRRMVTDMIEEWAGRGGDPAPDKAWAEHDRSEALGLALLDLPGLPAVDSVLRGDAEILAAAQAAQDRAYPGEAVPAVDLLLFALRKRARDQYGGWNVTVGKHRLLDGVEGSPYTGGAGTEVPEAAEAFALPRTPDSGERPVRVAILDSRIAAHPALAGRYLASSDALLPAGAQEPLSSLAGHCTFVAGLILQRAPDAELLIRSVLGDDGVSVSSWDVAKRMAGFLNEDVDLLNLSFGCTTVDHAVPLVLARAVERLAPRMLLVAAAGNHGAAPPSRDGQVTAATPVWPAACDEVVAVGSFAAGSLEERAAFSPNLPWVDLIAPGEKVRSLYLDGDVRLRVRQGDELTDSGLTCFAGFATWSGTSFAAAAASGEIARLAQEKRIGVHEALRLVREPGATSLLSHEDVRPFAVDH
ncbi:hypothetical protein GCM10023194_37880 [Planotetraspora phitsanulokensis]|uniref:Peptidase S8/S53 domain-containing protein n=1 Tax=Planotetraspora phitsanulokensis TaxID=575192 RepID=A0A8J3UF77_9ACTN|nr:S8 family serine peptidase [Planotetraspora phitsanulokensis]GII41249.1 hypothetical protein Pph01_62520 [Planotetraspora phitsanulokensis]